MQLVETSVLKREGDSTQLYLRTCPCICIMQLVEASVSKGDKNVGREGNFTQEQTIHTYLSLYMHYAVGKASISKERAKMWGGRGFYRRVNYAYMAVSNNICFQIEKFKRIHDMHTYLSL